MTDAQPTSASRGRVWLLLALLAVVAGWVVIRGIDSRIKAAAAVKQETLDLAIPTVSVIHPKPGALKDEIVLPGNIQAFTDAPVYARASGYLKHWYADLGMKVKAGQVLAEIDAPELDQEVRQAKGSHQQSEAALEQALANYEQGKANAELARISAGRWNDLAARGIVSRQENDQYQVQYRAQQAGLQALEKAVSAARSNVSATEANLARLEELQRYKTVRAPFDGVITARDTDVGALISAGSGGNGQALFHLAAEGKLRVFVNVPQAYSRSAVPGVTADLTLPEFPGRTFTGRLTRTAEAIDPATRTLLTEVDIDNSSGQLRPGAYTEVHLKLQTKTAALILPATTLIFRGEGLQVGIVRENRPEGGNAELVPITLGRDYGTEVEVTSGISQADEVIVNPPDSLAAGMTVRVAASGSK